MDAKVTNITAPTLHFYKDGQQSGSYVGDSLAALEVKTFPGLCSAKAADTQSNREPSRRLPTAASKLKKRKGAGRSQLCIAKVRTKVRDEMYRSRCDLQ